MRKIIILLVAVLLSASIYAQSLQNMSYQAVIRNTDNTLVNNTAVGIRISILQGSATGTSVYVETQNPTTNANGLVTLEIGSGSVVSGIFDSINWANGPYFIKTETDVNGGSNYSISGTSPLLSVPYAIYANQAGSANYNNLTNAPTLAKVAITGSYNDLIDKPGSATSDTMSKSLLKDGVIPLTNSATNVSYGPGAGNSINSTALDNSSFGYASNYVITSASDNTGVGFKALFTNIEPENTAVGSYALYTNYTGTDNTATGYTALYSNSSGTDNTAMGFASLYNITGSYNTGIGSYALQGAGGDGNTAIGYEALTGIGNDNTATGAGALGPIDASYNTADGFYALFHCNSPYNTATGYEALYGNTNTGSGYNTAAGAKSLYSNTSGAYNTATGSNALASNTTASYNTADGFYALASNTIGYNNVANGYYALYKNLNGDNNTANGFDALYANTAGYMNTADGDSSLASNTTGSKNKADGYQALASNTTGSENTAVGYTALQYNTTGNYNTAIGVNAGPSSGNTGLSNTGSFGYGSYVTASQTIEIGNSAITTVGGFCPWYTYSDGRFKTNVKENIPGLDFILKLRPVSYNWNLHALDTYRSVNDSAMNNPELEQARLDKEKKSYTGFIAQDVEKAADSCGFDFSGISKPVNDKTPYSLSYADFVVPLVKAVQEQQKKIEELEKMIEELKSK